MNALVYIGYWQVIDELERPTQLRKRLLSFLPSQGFCRSICYQNKIIRQKRRAELDTVFLCQALVCYSLDSDNEGVLDAENGISRFIRVISDIQGA